MAIRPNRALSQDSSRETPLCGRIPNDIAAAIPPSDSAHGREHGTSGSACGTAGSMGSVVAVSF